MARTLQDINYGAKALKRIKAGVDKAVNITKSTLGPNGRSVLIERQGLSPYLTKDGVTVINSIQNLRDDLENLGLQIIKEVSSRSNYYVGDGTTSSTVLAQELFNRIYKKISKKYVNVYDIKKGIEDAAMDAVDYLQSISKKVSVNSIYDIAQISSNNDNKISDVVSQAFQEVGSDGIVCVEEQLSPVKLEVESSKGLKIPTGYVSNLFLSDTKNQTLTFTNPLILIADRDILTQNSLVCSLNIALNQNRPLVIICNEIKPEALTLLVLNKNQRDMKIAVIKSPYYGKLRNSVMQDIAVYTGGTVISVENGIDITKLTDQHFGTCDLITISESETVIERKDQTPELADYVKNLKENLKKHKKGQSEHTNLINRISSLTSGAVKIKVGGNSDIETTELKDRVDDTICACRASLESGYLSGAGSSLLQTKHHLKHTAEPFLNRKSKEYAFGYMSFINSLGAVTNQLLLSSGCGFFKRMYLKYKMKKYNMCWNCRTKELEYCDKTKIIDPTKVVINVVNNSISAVSTLITVYGSITTDKDHLKTLTAAERM